MEDRPIKKKTEVHGGQNVELPPEIIDAILLRLPVKPLCRFKLVSKSWQSLISHPDFVANHSKAAVENKDRRRLALYQYFNFARDNCYCLINPVTKESKKLPKPPIWRLPLDPCFLCVYALGFDHSTNEYKVINGQEYDDGLVFSVYTLQTGSWRKIDVLFPYQVCGCLDGIMVNGHVHWLARKVADQSLVIISFLLGEEKVREIALPPNAPNDSIRLRAFRDWLCVTSTSYIAIFNEFWVMKKYGVSESWAKMRVSKPYKDLSHSGFWTETLDLMVFNKKLLVMYNFNDDKFWTLSTGGVVETIRSIGSYVETLSTLTHQSRSTSSKEDDSDIIETSNCQRVNDMLLIYIAHTCFHNTTAAQDGCPKGSDVKQMGVESNLVGKPEGAANRIVGIQESCFVATYFRTPEIGFFFFFFFFFFFSLG
ncbi:hypothetical protein ACLB2K_075870 [Fragaria x ananassa]